MLILRILLPGASTFCEKLQTTAAKLRRTGDGRFVNKITNAINISLTHAWARTAGENRRGWCYLHSIIPSLRWGAQPQQDSALRGGSLSAINLSAVRLRALGHNAWTGRRWGAGIGVAS